MAERDNIASRLRHRITLQQPDLNAGAGGQYSVEWQDVATVWAEVTPLESRALTAETVLDAQLTARVSHEIILRYREGVTADMRVAMDGRHFNIRSVVNSGERNRVLRLLAEEQAAV